MRSGAPPDQHESEAIVAGRHERNTEAAAVLRAVMDAHPDQLYVKRLAELAGCDDSHIRHCLAGNRTIGVELLCAAFAVTRERALLNLILGDVRAEVRLLEDLPPTDDLAVSELLPLAVRGLERAAAACRRVAEAAADGHIDPADRNLVIEFERFAAAAAGNLEAVRVAMRRMAARRPCMEAR